MKNTLKRLDSKIIEVKREPSCFQFDKYHTSYVFEIDEKIIGTGELVVYLETEEPETLNEFLEQENISKKFLLEWLKQNYK